MSFYSSFYRSLFYLHAFVALTEFALSFGLLIVIIFTNQQLFFKVEHPDDKDWELVGMTNWIIIMVLYAIGTIRTVMVFVFISCVFFGINICWCFLLSRKNCQAICKFCMAKASHRFIAFNCNCPCYRARPKLRFQLQFLFVILSSCIRISTIAFCLSLRHNITTKSIAVIIGISFFFLLLTSTLDYYHYRVWWHYNPNFRLPNINMPTTPLSVKHRRYLPYQLLGSKRTGQHGDKLCKHEPCTNRELEHILIFHLSDYQPQPRWSELKRHNPKADIYIGFHRTSAESALLISHSDFRRSTTPPQMLGFGIYFARSIENTIGKARFQGAIIAAEIRMGKVKEVTEKQLHKVRNTDNWYPKFDTVYYNHEQDHRDEFCVHDESQVLNWIIVVDEQFDIKPGVYGMNQEFNDTKCLCI